MKTFAAITAHIRKAAARRNSQDKAAAQVARRELAEDGTAREGNLRGCERSVLGKGGYKRHSAILTFRHCFEWRRKTKYFFPRKKGRGRVSRLAGSLASSARYIADSILYFVCTLGVLQKSSMQ